jgi:hypothetical protein
VGDEGGGMAVLGGDFDLLVDHGVSLCFMVLVLRGRSIRWQGNRSMTRQPGEVARALNDAARIAIVVI